MNVRRKPQAGSQKRKPWMGDLITIVMAVALGFGPYFLLLIFANIQLKSERAKNAHLSLISLPTISRQK